MTSRQKPPIRRTSTSTSDLHSISSSQSNNTPTASNNEEVRRPRTNSLDDIHSQSGILFPLGQTRSKPKRSTSWSSLIRMVPRSVSSERLQEGVKLLEEQESHRVDLEFQISKMKQKIEAEVQCRVVLEAFKEMLLRMTIDNMIPSPQLPQFPNQSSQQKNTPQKPTNVSNAEYEKILQELESEKSKNSKLQMELDSTSKRSLEEKEALKKQLDQFIKDKDDVSLKKTQQIEKEKLDIKTELDLVKKQVLQESEKTTLTKTENSSLMKQIEGFASERKEMDSLKKSWLVEKSKLSQENTILRKELDDLKQKLKIQSQNTPFVQKQQMDNAALDSLLLELDKERKVNMQKDKEIVHLQKELELVKEQLGDLLSLLETRKRGGFR